MFKGKVLIWLSHLRWQPRVAFPPSTTFSSGSGKWGSSLGEHLVSGQYLMRNSSLSQLCFVDIVSIKSHIPIGTHGTSSLHCPGLLAIYLSGLSLRDCQFHSGSDSV